MIVMRSRSRKVRISKSDLPEGTRVLYDKGVSSEGNRQILKERGLRDGIMRKKPKGQEMSRRDKQRNRAISHRRFVVERTFGTIKRSYGFHRARYIGIGKVHAESVLKSISYRRAMTHYQHMDSYCG